VVPALVIALLVAGGCSTGRRATESIVEHALQGPFYKVPAPFPAGAPGVMIKHERLLGAPDGSIAWRIMYHSRDVHGNDVPVTGVVVAPTGSAPKAGRPVVAWAHPTTGSAEACAPSRFVDPFVLMEGLHEFLADGDVVVATDYPGMGAAGPSSYLIGTSEGNSVLDSVRAARSISDAHAGDRLLLWGHSQGGQAALFAAHDATRYAPELKLVGVAVAAPAVELGTLLRDDVSDFLGVGLGAYAFAAYQQVYGEVHGTAPPTPSLSTILTPAGVAATPAMAKTCSFPGTADLKKLAQPLVGRYLSADPARVEPWKTWLAQNVPAPRGIGVPILVAQGENDKLVHVATTNAYVHALCANGERVDYDTMRDASHALIGFKAGPQVRKFFRDLVAGHTVKTTCAGAG
jgi:pimeloyl-ACP methyl ester carboxylesterase